MGAIIVRLGDQLFPHLAGLPHDAPIFMREDAGLARAARHHRQKLTLFFAAMRHHAADLQAQGRRVEYQRALNEDPGYGVAVVAFARQHGATEVWTTQIHDAFFATELQAQLTAAGLTLHQVPSPSFLTPRTEWEAYRRAHRRLLMADFYARQRKRLGLLLNDQGGPEGGQWSYDPENRQRVPRGVVPPYVPPVTPDSVTRDVMQEVAARFPDHPGEIEGFGWAVTRAQAQAVLTQFVEERLPGFGPYEDAIVRHQPVLWHSTLSPLMNLGLVTPDEVVAAAMARYRAGGVSLPSIEGFVRQVIGWREFIYHVDGDYRAGGQHRRNGLGHVRRLGPAWWQGTTGLPPVDDAIRQVLRTGWCHHIERLMILGATMLMVEAHPDEVYDWFMAMFVDSAEWVMRPNVYGMSQFADGGFFATKPYISGSAYVLKMSDYPKGPWTEIWDGLYWRFIDRQRTLFESNPRMSMMVRQLDKMAPARRAALRQAADEFADRVTLGAMGTS